MACGGWPAPANPGWAKASVIRHVSAGEESFRSRMRGNSAFRRTGARRKRLRMLSQRLRDQISVARLKIRPADEEVAAERNHRANLRAADIGERRLAEKKG